MEVPAGGVLGYVGPRVRASSGCGVRNGGGVRAAHSENREAVGRDRDWRRSFVEDFCELDLVAGMPRASLRVLGWMIVCQPAVQSAQQIMEELSLSAGSVSTAVNALHDEGLLERVTRTGDRHVYYRLRAQGWDRVLKERFRSLGEVRRAADRALQASGGEADQRLHELRDLYGRMESGLSELLARRPTPIRRDV
jgi:DNA-binding transcriptional regulator GbsR (MarR family)